MFGYVQNFALLGGEHTVAPKIVPTEKINGLETKKRL